MTRDCFLPERREEIGRRVGRENDHEDRESAAREGQDERDGEPDEAEAADLRQPLEQPVQAGDPLADDPVL